MKTFALMIFVQAETLEEARECWMERGKLDSPLFPVPQKDWPIWAKALKATANPEDKGIGDVVARKIGDEKSEAFKAWHLATFGKPCNCTARRERWNRLYPLNQ